MFSPTWQLIGGLLSLPALGASSAGAGPAAAGACSHLILGAAAIRDRAGASRSGCCPRRGLTPAATSGSPGVWHRVSRSLALDEGHWLVCWRLGASSTLTGLLRYACAPSRRSRLPSCG